jgi:hypothetical protein
MSDFNPGRKGLLQPFCLSANTRTYGKTRLKPLEDADGWSCDGATPTKLIRPLQSNFENVNRY